MNLSELTALSCIDRVCDWNKAPRLYINLRGASPHHNGDGNLRIYFDKVKKTLHWQKGRGVLSDGMIASMKAFEEAVGIDLWAYCREGVAIELDADAMRKWYS